MVGNEICCHSVLKVLLFCPNLYLLAAFILTRVSKPFYLLVQVVIEVVESLRGLTIGVVPPVANKHLLVEHGASRAKEAVLTAIKVTIMINLE